MPHSRNPKKEPEGNRHFITEKIIKQSLTRGQLMKRGIAFICLAVMFGVVAAVSFVVSQPLAFRYLGPEPTERPTISIPRDEPAETTTVAVVTTEADTEQSESRPLEEMVQAAVDNYRYTIDDLNALTGSLNTQVQATGQAVVTVHSVRQDVDWFDNPVETTGLYAGVIIVKTEQELLILTREAAVGQADSIRVTFTDGTEVDGRMKQQDTVSGMAIVSVDTADFDRNMLEALEPLPLGNSYLIREGDLIIAVGSPAGIVHSIDYGFISYVMKNAQMVDRTARVLYSGIRSDARRGTFFINTSGELIGWAVEPDEDEAGTSMVKIMGISDYKGILENLTNGLGAPCIGIEGQMVSESMVDGGMPAGIYVMNAVPDRPAYNAGIQNGDIVTMVDGQEITAASDFQNIMGHLECGQLIHVTVCRNGRDEYAELEFPVTVGAR